MPRRETFAPVELVEDDELEPVVLAAPVRKRRRWWFLAVPVAVLGLVLGAQLLIDARERAADARIAALPGAVQHVGDSLDVRWQTDPGDAPLAWGTYALGALHGVLVGSDGSLEYTALDVDTGTHRWSTTLRGPDPALTDPLNSTTTSCQPSGDDRAVCLVTDGYGRYSDDGTDEGRPATEAHVVVLDLVDGSVLADRPAPPVSSLAVLPGLVATAVVDDRRHLVVVATDPMTGDELWRYRDVDPVRGKVDEYTAALASAGDLLVLFNRPSGPLVLTGDGTTVEPDKATDSWQTTNEGWLAWSRPNHDGADPHVRVMRPGHEPLEVLGDLMTRSVDDGSLPGLEVSSGVRTYGWDSRTGRQLWEAHVAAVQSWQMRTMIIEGRVYLATTTEVVALDGHDGTVLWRTPRPSGAGIDGGLFTDGTHLLLLDSPLDPSGTADLLVMDRHDGTALRRVPFPTGIASADAVGGRLVSGGEHGVTGVG